MEFCYLVRRNAISTSDIRRLKELHEKFIHLRDIFVASGVRVDISLPRQHALLHYLTSIPMFGSPNGLCSSITESKHIKAVKEPWRRSNRYKALPQMLRILTRMDKLAALYRVFAHQGMMSGTTSSYTNAVLTGAQVEDSAAEEENDENDDEIGPVSGPKSLSSIKLATTTGRYFKDETFFGQF
jgi:hypothetical protein